MNDEDYQPEEKIAHALDLFYPEQIPEDIDGAVDAIVEFYQCGGKEEKKNDDKPALYRNSKQKEQNYSFEQDAAYIYAAFLTQYGIDLNSVEYLHWWKFAALFESLGEEHKISKIMYYRSADLKGKSKQERRFLKKMKEIYALKHGRSAVQKQTLSQRNASMKEYVRKRFAEAGEQNGK